MVVKNVSGFDMMRIHYGAMGTLGVIVSANFKVLPLPRSEFSMTTSYDTLARAVTAATSLRSSAVRPVAVVVRHVDGSWQVAARYEGRSSGLSAVRSRLANLEFEQLDFLDDATSRAYWADLMAGRRLGPPDEIRIRVSVAPTLALDTAHTVQARAPAELGFTRFEIEPGLGLITMSVETPTSDAVKSFVQSLRADLESAHVALVAAPDPVKSGLDVWGEEPATLEIMRALKREFDPAGILNPGCFVGSI
jgi:glycolate oxidase FAD binding subunit